MNRPGAAPMDDLETLPHGALREQVDWPLLAGRVPEIARRCPFYGSKFGRDVRLYGWDDFLALPFTWKDEILEEQTTHPPFGRFLGVQDPATILRVHRTSGTTGRALYIAMSARDAADTLTAGRRAFRCAGLEPGDLVVHCLNYCMWAGGLTDHLSLEATGAGVVPFGVGHTSALIQAIKELKANAISCTPSYLARLQVVLKEDFGMQPRDLALTKAFFGGEGGLQNPEVRRHIEETWGIQAIDANYGMADVLSLFGAECGRRQGLHFHGQGIVHLELVDPATGAAVPVTSGSEGEMVLTNLTRECQPLVRFRTGDVIRVVGTDACACGRSSLRFMVMGRSDQMVVVRGVNVFPGAIKNLLLESPERFTGEFRVDLPTPPPHDRVRLLVELAQSAQDVPDLRGELEGCLRRMLNFSPVLTFLSFGELPRTEGKTCYVVRSYLN